MLFMGEEYGELSPFQFFTAHIDPEIAEATRTGRRDEFKAFASFGGEIPDPEDPATFERSKLSRRGDPGLARLYRELIAARRRLPRDGISEVEYDEVARWLIARRGAYEMLCNFASGPVRVPCTGQQIELAAGGEPHLEDGYITLPGMSAALAR
jgi:maltooligosyltrehalose trehalohydrolase